MSKDLANLQDQRTAKATEMLAEGRVTITVIGLDQWLVSHDGGEAYLVYQQSDGTYVCNCWDYVRRNVNGLRCKHIEIVRLTNRAESKNKGGTTMNENEFGWVKLYHPVAGGIQVTLPLPTTAEQAKLAFDSVGLYLQAGFLATQVGLEEGEKREAVTHIVKREKTNNDHTISPVLDVYTMNGNFRTLTIYLDKEEDIAAYLAAFKIPLEKLPKWEGDTAIERGKNTDRDAKYCVAVSGVEVVYKPNPKYEGDNDKKHPKRLFVRWESKITAGSLTPPSTTASMQANPSTSQTPPPPPVVPAAAQQPATASTVRRYGDGKLVSENPAEVEAFDKYLNRNSKVPQSIQVLRSWAG